MADDQEINDALRGLGVPESACSSVVGLLRQLAEREERHAWDIYAAHADYRDAENAAKRADGLLVERRKRFRGGA